jgi:hypothetical protein
MFHAIPTRIGPSGPISLLPWADLLGPRLPGHLWSFITMNGSDLPMTKYKNKANPQPTLSIPSRTIQNRSGGGRRPAPLGPGGVRNLAHSEGYARALRQPGPRTCASTGHTRDLGCGVVPTRGGRPRGRTSTAAAPVGPRPHWHAPGGDGPRARGGRRGGTPAPGVARPGPVGGASGPHARCCALRRPEAWPIVRLRQLQGHACAELSCSGDVRWQRLRVRTRARQRCGPRPEAAGPHGRGGRPTGSPGLLARLAANDT